MTTNFVKCLLLQTETPALCPGISVGLEKLFFPEARSWVVAHNITDFTETASWCYRIMNMHGLSTHAWTAIVQKMPANYEANIMQSQKLVTLAKQISCLAKLS
jgi:hypothetical protein